MEVCITQTQTAQLEAQTEHFTIEQTAVYAMLTTNAQRAAFIASVPLPVENTGPLHLVVKLDGAKIAGFPTWMLAKKLVKATALANAIDATSNAIAAGTVDPDTGEAITRHDLSDRLTVELVHSAETPTIMVGGVELDTEAAGDARQARDDAYQQKRGGANGAINPSAQPTVNLG